MTEVCDSIPFEASIGYAKVNTSCILLENCRIFLNKNTLNEISDLEMFPVPRFFLLDDLLKIMIVLA